MSPRYEGKPGFAYFLTDSEYERQESGTEHDVDHPFEVDHALEEWLWG